MGTDFTDETSTGRIAARIAARDSRDSLAAAASRPAPLVEYQAGDLIAFAGRDPLSHGIAWRTCTWRQLLTGRWFSHVGIICDYSPAKGGNVGLGSLHHGQLRPGENRGAHRTILVESTTFDNRPCFIRGVHIKGVQAHLPTVRVSEYPGSVWRLRLRRPLATWERQALSQFCLSTLGQPYNYRRAAELATFFWQRTRELREETPAADSWFCSDHALTALKACDRVDHDHDPEEFSPGGLVRLVERSGEVWPIGSGAAARGDLVNGISSRSLRVK